MEHTMSDAQKNQIGQLDRDLASVFLGAPIAIDDNRIVTTVDWADGALAIAAQPDCPRNITVVLTDVNDSVTGKMIIRGVDAQGRVVEEVMEPDGAGGGKTLAGTKIFGRVDVVQISGTAGALAGTDKVIVGVGNLIGLPMDIAEAAEVKRTYFNGALVDADAIAVGESTSGIDANGSTYDGADLMFALVQQLSG